MNAAKQFLRFFLAVVFIIIAASLLFTRNLKHRALPNYEKTLIFSQLSDSVTIYRDEMAIPHIYANNEYDVYFATGYIMAQERLWQMDLLRRVTQGRLSEIFGNDFIDTDVLLRSLRFEKKSDTILSYIDNKQLVSLEAFANGVNHYIELHKKKLPFEFKLLGYLPDEWKPAHSLNLIGYMAWDLKSGWDVTQLEKLKTVLDSAHYVELFPDMTYHRNYVFNKDTEPLPDSNLLSTQKKLEGLGVEILCGSNTWAVSGDRSKTGKPLLANDMHLSFGLPGIWFQVHQHVPGQLNISGLAIPGAPLVVVGHNDSIAWGMTNTYVDNLDFYEEKVHASDTGKYLYNDKYLNFSYQKELIRSKDGNEYSRIIQFSHRGPVVSQFKGVKNKTITMHWVGEEPSNEYASIYNLNRANNWKEFKDAMRTFKSIGQNISYVDKAGNIGQYACAGVPIRNRDITSAVLPGWTDTYDWQGMIPFDELPHVYNPTSGSVSSANNRTTDNSYPYHIGTWYSLPYRFQRINELLNETEIHSVESFKTMQNDYKSKLAELFLESNLKKFSTDNLTETELNAFNSLAKWNFVMDKELVAPTIFEHWLYYFIETATADELAGKTHFKMANSSKAFKTLLYNLLNNPESVWYDNIQTDTIETQNKILQLSFKNTIEALSQRFGEDTSQWKWSNVNTLTLEHPMAEVEALEKAFNLNVGPVEVNGSFHTVAPFSFSYKNIGKVIHGASHRNIYNLANWDSSYTVIPAGNSGQPKSKYYANQSKLYFKGKYRNDWFSEKAVKENAKFVQVYVPGVEE